MNMVEICALASGSNGNAYYIGNEKEAILIDAGISRRQLLKRMRTMHLDINKIIAVFISHEHTDHVRGFRSLCETQPLPGYISTKTYGNVRKNYLPDKVHLFNPGDSVQLQSIVIHSFTKQHDAGEPCSFRIEIDGYSIGVMTDLGIACANVKEHFAKCHAVFLETNYDDDMLRDGPYPLYLKNRVSSNKGHLSNKQAFELVSGSAGEQLSALLLSHISADNNRVDFALNTFAPFADRYKIVASSRYEPSEVVALQ
jgi:phosphoribosyl 1,2-cyclic phosphodiesterase